MFYIKNREGLFFNGHVYKNYKWTEQWHEDQMTVYKTKEEAVETTEYLDDFFAVIISLNTVEKEEKIKDKRYLYTSAFDPVKNAFVGIAHAFERDGVFYFVCYYSQGGQLFIFEEEKLIKFCL